MVIIEELKKVVENNKSNPNPEYRRNILKESLQVYILNFIYTSKYKDLIFTGGTCLRKFYDLPRISEDLDFNYENADFNFDDFQNDLNKYLIKQVGFSNFSLKFNGRTVLIKLPILREVGFAGSNDSEVLYLKIDFAQSKGGNTNSKAYTKNGFSFIAKCYDLDTLFVNKVDAFLNRVYKRGNIQKVNFKGRDAFDIYWMFNDGRKLGLDPKLLTKNLVSKILDKSKQIKPDELYSDLSNFFSDQAFARQFCDNYYDLLKSSINNL
ncbi:MAG: nucleotidyl transferase AbiEii/AbiGii toxin family protein [bacterium]|nr:MAG: nucleotidyl transferase AbiEii/AbiGii toxin family protein [bacterium]